MALLRPKPLTPTQWAALAYCAEYAPHPRSVHTSFWGSAKGSEGLRHDTLAVLQLRGLIDTFTEKPRVAPGRDGGSYWQATTRAQVTPKGLALLARRPAKPNARRAAPVPPVSRPRAYVPPRPSDPEARRFRAAVEAAGALLRPDDPDLRVIAKWQRYPAQMNAGEVAEILRIGEWARAQGWFDPPEELWRVVRLPGYARALSPGDAAALAEAAGGVRSWSRDPDDLVESFAGRGGAAAIFHWAPPAAEVVIDGDAFEAGLYAARPALYAALAQASMRGTTPGRAGFDDGECVARPQSLRVARTSTEVMGGRHWHDVEVVSGATKPNGRRPAPGQAALPGFGAPPTFPEAARRVETPPPDRTRGAASAAGFLMPLPPPPEPEEVPFVEPPLSDEDIAETLFMVIDNTGEIYRGPRAQAELMLARRHREGQYQTDRAMEAYAATIAAGVAELQRELRADPDAPRMPITPAVRRLVAQVLVRHFEADGFGQHRLPPAPVRAPKAPPSPPRSPAPRVPSVAAYEADRSTAMAKARTLLERAEAKFAQAEKGEASREGANTVRRQEQARAIVQREYTEAATAAQRVLSAIRQAAGVTPGEAVDAWGRMANRAAELLASATARASGTGMQAVWKAETSTEGADYFPTPPALAHEMVAIADIRPDRWALEPSAGKGVIVAELLRHTGKVAVVEADPHRAAYLERQYKLQAYVTPGDFLTFRPPTAIDAIVMNPPFTSPGDPVAYVAHVEHALGMLGKGGSLVALVPSTFGPDHRNARVRALHQHLVARLAEIEPVPRGHRFGTAAIPVTMIRFGRALRSHEYPLTAPDATRR